MPGRAEVRRSKLKVGALIVLALAAVAAGVVLITGNAGVVFASKLEVRAYFRNTTDLKVGAPVKLDGVTIGNVRAVRIVEHPARTPVEVVMAIQDKYANDLLTDSHVNLNTVGVLGSMELDIDNVHARGQPVKNHAVLQTGGVPNLQDALQEFQQTNQKLGVTLNQANVLLGDLSSNKGSIGKLINDPTLREHASAAMKQFTAVPTDVSEGKGTVGKLLQDHSLLHHAKDMQSKFSDISAAIDSGQGTAGKFMKDPALGRNLKEASKQLHEISSEVKSGQGAVAMMAHNADFKQKLHDTGSELSALQGQMSAGQGTLGQMKKNPALDKNLKDLMKDSRELVTGLRKHPLKYARIRFRIF